MLDAGVGAAAAATASNAASTSLTESSKPEAGIVVDDLDDDLAGGPAASEVTLRVPPGARLYVDGRQLPAGTESVGRPDAGFVTVLVKAEAHQDALIEITPTSPDEIVVTMAEKPKPRRHVTPPEPASTIAMPPNPYE